MTACPHCVASPPQPEGRNFCTACGRDLRESSHNATAPLAVAPLPPEQIGFAPCPHCGAPNAASRILCGHCRLSLDPDARLDPPTNLLAPPLIPPVEVPQVETPQIEIPPVEPESSRWLLVVTLIAGLVTVVVLLTLLNARGVGVFPAPASATLAAPSTTRLEVVAIQASSTLPPAGQVTYDASNVRDRDPSTAWSEGAQSAVGEWIELQLPRQASITRLLIWNGFQKGAQFTQHGCVQRLLIEAGGRRFAVELYRLRGSQAVDLPTPVRDRTVRLTIDAIFEGTREPHAALSEVEIYGAP
jgi:hypothetical protein